ncbi:hypothetical protein, partial [Pseudomonas sp. AGC67]
WGRGILPNQKVFFRVSLSAADVQKRYQVDISRGRDYVETDVPKHMLKEKKNPRYGSLELTIWGNLKLINPTFVRRK